MTKTTNPQHGPGPWQALPSNRKNPALGHRLVCNGRPYAYGTDYDMLVLANRMNTFHDLLAALETLLGDFYSGVGLRDAISEARAAIAKAKGIEKQGVYPTADEIEEEIRLRARGISY